MSTQLTAKQQLVLAKAIAQKYQLPYATIHPPQSGYRNLSFQVEMQDGFLVNLMIFKAEAGNVSRLARADRASRLLSERGLPARERLNYPLMTLRSNSQLISEPRIVAIYNYLPGETIGWEAYTKNHIKLVGMTMGAMHQAWSAPQADVTNQVLAKENSIYQQTNRLLERMEDYFSRQGVRTAMKSKLGLELRVNFTTVKKIIVLAKASPAQHALHMDFVRSNILFSNSQIDVDTPLRINDLTLSGILDFEKVSFGNPLFDLARTLAFLFVDCKYKSTDKIRKYFLYSGYQKRSGVQLPNLYHKRNGKVTNLLDKLVELFLLHDFYKFLKHNPYESLDENEHYLRTRDILESRGMLKYSV